MEKNYIAPIPKEEDISEIFDSDLFYEVCCIIPDDAKARAELQCCKYTTFHDLTIMKGPRCVVDSFKRAFPSWKERLKEIKEKEAEERQKALDAAIAAHYA